MEKQAEIQISYVELEAGFFMVIYTYKNQIKRGLTPFYFFKIAEHNKPLCNLKVISISEDTGVGLVHQRVT